MIVDLERNDVIDLLPDRSADTLAAWLRRHQGVEIIARDRAEVFAEGIRAGAPSARQVIDRWHLLCNLSDAFSGDRRIPSPGPARYRPADAR
jgi:transposase